MKKIFHYLFFIIVFASCSKAVVSVSEKQFPSISLINHYEYFQGKHEFKQLGTAFLLKYKNDTFAITAKGVARVDSRFVIGAHRYLEIHAAK